jgi:hypothetical protein
MQCLYYYHTKPLPPKSLVEFFFNPPKDHGVEKIYHLSPQLQVMDESQSLVYLTRPNLSCLSFIAAQVKHQTQKQHSIFFVPRRTLVCDRYLEQEGILGQVDIGEFHLDLIAFDEVLLSLEMPNTLRSLFVDGDISIISLLSNALIKFQILYGFFPRVLGKGDYAEMLVFENYI